MKKLILKNQNNKQQDSFIDRLFESSNSERVFINTGKRLLSNMTIEFYDYVGEMLNRIGFDTLVTREGDVNCRFDATIKDAVHTIPIEIKSPLEVNEINIKAITQACENKIVLLSRHFFPTKKETTSLAIGFEYPPSRSDVYELIDNIFDAYNINIGIVDTESLLRLVYDVEKNGAVINMDYFNTLKGVLNYEEVIIAKN